MEMSSPLPDDWQLPEAFRRRLGVGAGRQRPMRHDGHLLLVLHAPPSSLDTSRTGRFFWRDPQGNWQSNPFGAGIAALNQHLDEYDERIAALDQSEEKARTADEYFAVLEELTPLHRAARNMHQVLQEARSMYPDYGELIDVRDRAYSIERNAELLFGGTKNALEFTVARQAENQAVASQRMSVAAHRLNLLAAFFFPILTISAILSVDLVTVADLVGIEAAPGTRFTLAAIVVLLAVGLSLGVILTALVVGWSSTASGGAFRDGRTEGGGR